MKVITIFRTVSDLVLIMEWRLKELLRILRELIKIRRLASRLGQVNKIWGDIIGTFI